MLLYNIVLVITDTYNFNVSLPACTWHWQMKIIFGNCIYFYTTNFTENSSQIIREQFPNPKHKMKAKVKFK